MAAKIKEIINEDVCNDTYGHIRMHQALKLKKEETPEDFPDIPSECTVYRIMNRLGLIHTPKHKPNWLTKADKEVCYRYYRNQDG